MPILHFLGFWKKRYSSIKSLTAMRALYELMFVLVFFFGKITYMAMSNFKFIHIACHN